MRGSLTWSEAALWRELSGSKLGVAFRRQVCIGRYIADFAAPSVRLVVEVDGGWHERRGAADGRRDRELARAGWRVVRVSAECVEKRLGEALAEVRKALG
jgi:very-short-patch-repair endonuclease